MNLVGLIEGSRYRAEKAKQQEKQQVVTNNAFQELLNAINKLSLSFMMSQKSAVTPQKSTSDKSEVLDVLYEILKELKVIDNTLSRQVPIGKFINIPNGLSLTAGDTYVDFIKGLVNYPDNSKVTIPTYRLPLFSISIENEGADDCVISINPDESWGKRTLDSDETYELDMKKAVIIGLKITVATGDTCTIQISGVV